MCLLDIAMTDISTCSSLHFPQIQDDIPNAKDSEASRKQEKYDDVGYKAERTSPHRTNTSIAASSKAEV